MDWLIENVQLLVTGLITGLTGGFGGWFFTRQKQKAEVKATELENVEKATAIWRQLAEDLKKEVQELRDKLDEVYEELHELRAKQKQN